MGWTGMRPMIFVTAAVAAIAVAPLTGCVTDEPRGGASMALVNALGAPIGSVRAWQTAGGVTFLNLEDETGLINVICSPGLWARYRTLAQTATALLVRGTLQNSTGAASVVADKLQQIDLGITPKSRDFQ